MSFLKKLTGIFSPSSPKAEEGVYWIYVQCNRCGEKLRARVNLFNDLSVDYGEGEVAKAYYCRKVIIGEKLCFQPIEVTLSFDSNYKLVDQQISGGKLISKENYGV